MIKLGILGPPGSGKGTLCDALTKKYHMVHLATGNIFRKIIQENNVLGKKIHALITEGNYVPDSITIEVVQQHLIHTDTQNKGYVLDGFPRTLEQTKWLLQYASLDFFIILDVDYDIIMHRITGRRIHPRSNRVYHVTNNPPKVSGRDDITGESLIQREDDTIEKVQHRLEIYTQTSKEIVPLLKSHVTCIHINASQQREDMIAECLYILNKKYTATP